MRTPSLVVVSLVVAFALPQAQVCGAGSETRDPRSRGIRILGKTGGRVSSGALTSSVVVKFREGSEIVANGSLALSASGADSRAASAIAMAAVPGGVRPTFDRPTSELRADVAKARSLSGAPLADLSLYVDVDTASPVSALELARELESYDDVELAYVRPAPPPLPEIRRVERAKIAAAPATPDLSATQFYLEKAPGGFGILPTRDVPGGRGEGVRVIDIEYSWNLDHEDMPFNANVRPFLDERGNDPVPDDQGNHGTAALGMLVAVDNGYGVTGMCPGVEVGVVNPVTSDSKYKLELAIKHAADVLTRDGKRGDVIQVEQQALGINTEIAALPAEWVPAVFDAIQYAVAKGAIVVEPAGNGGINRKGKGRGVSLDRPELAGMFDRSSRDSGAIMVGGAIPVSATATSSSNFGSRVDVQGYGLYVTTLGYGDLYGGKNNPRGAYTAVFEGTSSATPCVTAVASIIQATLRARGLPELDPLLMRAVLAGTGSPDGSVRTKRVGPRPDAAAGVAGVADPSVPLITGISFSKKKGTLTVDGLYFNGGNAAPDQQSVIFVNDEAVRTEYVSDADGPNGTTTRLLAPDSSNVVAPGALTFVEVGTSAGPLSAKRIFVRKKKKK